MSFYKIGLWGLFLLLTNITLAQGQDSIVLREKIIWQKPIALNEISPKNKALHFLNSGDVDEQANVPYYTKSIKLPGDINPDFSVSIANAQLIWPTPEEHNIANDNIKNTAFNIEKHISKHLNDYYLEIRFLPTLYFNEQSFKKLEEFDIVISYKTRQGTNLKSSSEYSYAQNSVLSSGNWIKVKISDSGIHKISYSKLKEWGINNPQNVAVYGNGGKQLSSDNSKQRIDDLAENPILHKNNAIYFYAEGNVVWTYDYESNSFKHNKHDYSDYSYYFITEKEYPSKQLASSELQNSEYTLEINYFNDYAFHEIDEVNLIHSGNQWFGEKFFYSNDLEKSFSFSFPNRIIDSPINIEALFAARSTTSKTSFVAEINEEIVGSTSISTVTSGDHLGFHSRTGKIYGNTYSSLEDIDVKLSYLVESTGSIGYLDYLSLNVNRSLTFVRDELVFRNKDFVIEGLWNKYILKNNNKDLLIWDITTTTEPLIVDYDKNAQDLSFIYDATKLYNFIAFDTDGSFPQPQFVGNVPNQNLHGLTQADYLIVCPPEFKNEAIRLGELHKKHQELTYVVATTNEIYNEFTSGKPDVTAIRLFAKMFYDRANGDITKTPKNLLLFGDGSYDNRDGMDPYNMILTYQSNNSIHQTDSYVSDDYFGLLDDNEGSNITSDRVDIGIGRFPVSSIEEAKLAVDKSERYLTNQSLDDWKNQLTFIADDKDGNLHMRDANRLAESIDNKHSGFRLKKIYFDAFKKTSIGGNEKYPDVESEIDNVIHNGSLIINYTGHGGPNQLAHEAIITKGHISSWKNINKLSIFITATCEFSRYDLKSNEKTAGEMVFLNPLGGGIALFTTTRIVYSSLNYILNNSLYNCFFNSDDFGNRLSFGQIMMKTKHNSGTSVNKLNFTLLGDPALKPLYPNLKVSTTEINNIPISESTDSFKALSKNSVKGEILSIQNEKLSTFNGQVYVSVYDKKSTVKTRDNNGDGSFFYDSYDNILYKGVCTVKNGEFEFDFLVPKDIKYNSDNGKISYYAFSGEDKMEAIGAYDEVEIGGIATNISKDDKAPEINIWLNDKSFKSGQKTTPLPLLIAEIYDENGINTTGNGIGHDITCYVDDNKSNTVVLNDLFQADLDTYKSGSVRYLLSGLEEGFHTLTLKAWDNYNNSSEKSITFYIEKDKPLKHFNTKTYPNPVKKGDLAYFYFEHDEPELSFFINMTIYTPDGRPVTTYSSSVISNLNSISPMEWNADIEPGLYVYRISVLSESGRKGEYSGKIMVIP